MKNILALMHDDAGQESRLQAAPDVTRALNGHLTCLVMVYEVDDGSIATPPEKIAAHLSRHEVHVEILHDKATSSKVDDLLLDKAESGEFSYVVMGAYSRPRSVEALFGGVTRRMLRNSPIPLILAH